MQKSSSWPSTLTLQPLLFWFAFFVLRFPLLFFVYVFCFCFQGFGGVPQGGERLLFSGFPILAFFPKKQGLEGQGTESKLPQVQKIGQKKLPWRPNPQNISKKIEDPQKIWRMILNICPKKH